MSGEKPLRVVIADDHVPTRAGVRTALEQDGFEVCGEAASASDVIALALQENPDIVVLDVHMPGGGVAAARKIVDALPSTAVVMLTVSVEEDDLFDALRAGASGYLLKDIDPSRLGTTLRSVAAGEAALPRSLTAKLIGEFRGRDRWNRLPILRKLGAQLTEKEWTVLELLRDGATTAEMARRLGVAPVTIRTHVSAVLRKLGVGSRDEAIAVMDRAEQ